MSAFQTSVVGLPRSGTTWVGKIFDSHPDVLYFHEPDYVDRIPCVPYVTQEADLDIWRSYLETWQLRIAGRGSRRTFGKRPVFPKSYTSGMSGFLGKAAYGLRINSLALMERLGFPERSIKMSTFHEKAHYRVWKSVESLGRLPILVPAFPSQRFVHVIRHPCGFTNSVLQGDRRGKFEKSIAMSADDGLLWWAHRWAEKLGIDLSLEELVRSPAPVRLAWFWRLMNDGVRSTVSQSENYHAICYDSLCANPIQCARDVFEFAGISWCDQTEVFLQGSPNRKSESDYFSVNKDSVAAANAWSTKLSTNEIDRILEVAGPTWDSISHATSGKP